MLKSMWAAVQGDLPGFVADPLSYVESRSLGRSAPLVLRFGHKPVVFVSQPSGVRRVLIDAAEIYGKGDHQKRLRPLLGDGLITARGKRWEDARRAVRGQFSHQGLDEGFNLAVSTLMQQVVTHAAQTGSEVSLPEFGGRLTIRMATAAMFREPLSEQQATAIFDAANAAHHWVSDVMWRPVHLGTALPTAGNRRFKAFISTLEGVVEELKRDPKGVLASLSGLADVYGERAIRDEFVTMLLAGFETSGSTVAWLLYTLACHPEAVAWLREEVDALGQNDLTMGALRQMPRTRAVVDEVMRLYPATWWFAREAQKDDVLDGLPVKAGTSVFLCPWVLHRQPDLWEEPERFLPERWLTTQPDRNAYIPFGAGARTCIGQHLARAEFMAVAAAIVSAFDLEPLSGHLSDLRPVGGVTLAPPAEGLKVRFHIRQRTPMRRAA